MMGEGVAEELKANWHRLRWIQSLPPAVRRQKRRDVKQIIDDVRESREDIPKGMSFRPFRPYGQRQSVINAVAEAATEMFGVQITPRKVRTCWEWWSREKLHLKDF